MTIATGELDSLKYPTLPALLAAAKSPDAPLSFLTFGQYSGTGNLIAQTRIPYLNSLQRLANSDFTNASRARRYHHESVSAHIDAALISVHSESHPLPKRSRARSFISDAQISSKNIDRIVSHIPQSTPSNRLQQQCEIALAGFSSGLSVSANLKLGTFDSHNTNDVDQMELIPEFLAGVDYMMRRAEEIGIRDQLIVIIQSEMGRTPWYNQTGGKDHWSVTSMMAMGAGITGNRVIGSTGTNPETGFEQYPAQINPTTLAIDPEGIRIRPQHIQQALRTFTGINDHPFATRFALDLPEHEYLVRLFEG